jgi:hypothetical protein
VEERERVESDISLLNTVTYTTVNAWFHPLIA